MYYLLIQLFHIGIPVGKASVRLRDYQIFSANSWGKKITTFFLY